MTETVFAAGTDATTNKKSNAIVNNGANISLWAKGANLNAATATVKLQGSNKSSSTDTDWFDLDDATITLAVTATAYGIPVIACAYAYIRVVYTNNTNSAGSFESIINFQR